MLRTDPTARVKLPRIEQHEMRFLTPAQVADLAEAIDLRYRAFVLTGAYCGLRFGELAGLKVDRVDLAGRRLEVLEIVTEVNGHHVVARRRPGLDDGRCRFPAPSLRRSTPTSTACQATSSSRPPGGGYLRPSLFRRRFCQPATVEAGVEGLRLHDLRHTAVALWIAAGASPTETAARAGHASVVTVLDRYGHLLPGHEDKVNDALDAMAERELRPLEDPPQV